MSTITPPRELVEQWASEKCYDERDWLYELHIAARAAQWGADQELEACCEWLSNEVLCESNVHRFLRVARRPKPPSLREQALEEFNHLMGELIGTERYKNRISIVRRALEALPND
jgi:hypothetical protein